MVPALCAAPRLAWKDLEQWIGPDKRVRVETKDKAVLVGVLEEVQPQSRRIDVLHSSDPKRYLKGEAIVPHDAISRVSVRKETNKGRRRGALIMLPLAIGFALLGGQNARSEGEAVVLKINGTIFTVCLGYLVGLAADKAWTSVILEPPPQDTLAEPGPARDGAERFSAGLPSPGQPALEARQ